MADRAAGFCALFIYLAAVEGSDALAELGAAGDYALPHTLTVQSDRRIPGGKPVVQFERIADATAPPTSQTTPWEQNATLAELAGTDRVDLVRDRLAQGADPNAPGKIRRVSPLEAAAEVGQVQMVELLLRAGADANLVHGSPPLCAAASGGSFKHAEVARLLLRNGARVNDKCIMGYGPTPLMRAAETGSTETVKVLLAAGADVNAVDWAPNAFPRRDTTALMYAARQGHAEVVKLLLGAGANPNAKMLPYGWSALWLAAEGRLVGDRSRPRNYAAIAQALLQAGADVSAAPSSDSRTPLVVAARANGVDFVRVLLEFGANPNDRDPENQTPLMHAAKRGDAEMASALLEKGADPKATDKEGRTALQLARMLGRAPIEELLSAVDTTFRAPKGPTAERRSERMPVHMKAEVAWQVALEERVSGGPWLLDGFVLYRTYGGRIVALSAKTGAKRWQMKTEGSHMSPPLVHQGIVYFGAHTNLHAVDLASGKKLWEFTTSGAGMAEPPVLREEVIYLRSARDWYAIERNSGKEIWRIRSDSSEIYPPVLGGPLALLGAANGGLRATDAATGRVNWEFAAGGGSNEAERYLQEMIGAARSREVRAQLNSAGPQAFYTFGIGLCEAMLEGRSESDLRSSMQEFFGPDVSEAMVGASRKAICPQGTTREQIATARRRMEELASREGLASRPVVAGERVIVRTRTAIASGAVYVLDPASGKVILRVPTQSGFGSAPVATDKTLYFMDRFNLRAVTIPGGARVWSLDLEGESVGSDAKLVSFGDYLYVAGTQLIRVDPSVGSVVWKLPYQPLGPVAGLDSGRFCYALQDLALRADLPNGKVKWTAALEKSYGLTRGVACDERWLYYYDDRGEYLVYGAEVVETGAARE